MRYLIYAVAAPHQNITGLDFPNLELVDEGDISAANSTDDLRQWLQSRIGELRSARKKPHGQMMVWLVRPTQTPLGKDWKSTSWAGRSGWMATSPETEAAFVAMEVPSDSNVAKLRLLVDDNALFAESSPAR